MAIKILRTGLPVIGYAKIGVASAKDSPLKGSPMRWDHVELTGVERDSIGRLVPNVPLMRELIERGARTCGGCTRSKELGFPDGLPTQLGIFLPYNDLELNFPSRLTYFKGRTAYCTGDGEKAMRRTVVRTEKVNGKDFEILGAEKPHAGCGWDCPDLVARRCKPFGKLRFVLAIQENVGGCFEFKTTSLNSIPNITEGLSMIQAATGGVLQWIPLLFEVSPQTVQPRDGGRASTAYIARVTFPGSPQKLVEAVHSHLQVRAPMVAQIRQLESAIKKNTWSETPAQIDDIVEEFYQAAPDDDLNQDVFDPATGEVLIEAPTTSERGEPEPAASLEPGPPASAPADGAGQGDAPDEGGAFDASPEELAAERARTAAPEDTISREERDHMLRALDAKGFSGTTARLNWLRRFLRRNVTTSLAITHDEYGKLCLELGIAPRPPAGAAQIEIPAGA